MRARMSRLNAIDWIIIEQFMLHLYHLHCAHHEWVTVHLLPARDTCDACRSAENAAGLRTPGRLPPTRLPPRDLTRVPPLCCALLRRLQHLAPSTASDGVKKVPLTDAMEVVPRGKLAAGGHVGSAFTGSAIRGDGKGGGSWGGRARSWTTPVAVLCEQQQQQPHTVAAAAQAEV